MIEHDEIKMGDILIFKRKGFVSGVFAWLLKQFKRKWDRWGWHMAVAWEESKYKNGLWILEATSDGVRVGLLSEEKLKTEIKAYTWLDEPPSGEVMEKFMAEHLDKGYDVAVYFWTMAQYLLLKFVERVQRLLHIEAKISIPRVLDDRFTCWELAFRFCDEMGKPIQEAVGLKMSRYPMITDFLEAVKKQEA